MCAGECESHNTGTIRKDLDGTKNIVLHDKIRFLSGDICMHKRKIITICWSNMPIPSERCNFCLYVTLFTPKKHIFLFKSRSKSSDKIFYRFWICSKKTFNYFLCKIANNLFWFIFRFIIVEFNLFLCLSKKIICADCFFVLRHFYRTKNFEYFLKKGCGDREDAISGRAATFFVEPGELTR